MSSPQKLRVALIGFGYWGPNLARVVSGIEDLQLTWILDLAPERQSEARRAYPDARTGSSISEQMLDECDVIAIATPPKSHASLAEEAIEACKHVFVEKPFTLSSSDGQRLLSLASERHVLVQVDYTYLYTPEIQFLRALYSSGELGELNYLDSVRVNLGLIQLGANVIWDLAVHDFAIVDYLFGKTPLSVSASGATHRDLGILSAAFISVKYEDTLIANIHSSWLSPVKVRRMTLYGTEKTASFDDVEADFKIKVYDSTVLRNPDQKTMNDFLVSYRLGDVRIPRLQRWEALRREWELFVSRIREGSYHPVQEVDPVRVLRLAEAADASVSAGGQEIWIE